MKTLLLKIKIGKNYNYSSTYYEVLEYNGKKFKIYIEFSNGDCLGFNSKCCLSVMNNSGSWDKIVDNRQLGFTHNNDSGTYSSDSVLKHTLLHKEADYFKEYIEKVY